MEVRSLAGFKKIKAAAGVSLVKALLMHFQF